MLGDDAKAAIRAAHGRETASVLAQRYGVTRNVVIGLWHRSRDRAAAAAVAAVAPPFDPATAVLPGLAGAAWAAIVAAGPIGADAEAIGAVQYRDRTPPASWRIALYAHLRRLRTIVAPHGYTVMARAGVAPTRWCAVRLGEEPPAAPTDPDPAPGAPPAAGTVAARPACRADAAPVTPPPVGGRPFATSALAALTGAAAATLALTPRCCRWPIGEPGRDDFRFCGAPIWEEGKPYCGDHRRVATPRAA